MKNFASSIRITKVFPSGIPCLYLRPEDIGNNYPVVVLYHGWSSHKDNYLFMARLFVLHGYCVLVPDASYHGERGRLDYDDEEVMHNYIWPVIFASLDEFTSLLDFFRSKTEIDSSRIGLVGSSMGGITASGIFSKYPFVQTMVCMNGACAWEDAQSRVPFLAKGTEQRASYTKFIQKMDPLKQLAELVPRPILLQHGDCDSSIPVETQNYFHEEALKHYGPNKDRLRLSITKNLNHHKTIGMIEEVLDWLQMHLS